MRRALCLLLLCLAAPAYADPTWSVHSCDETVLFLGKRMSICDVQALPAELFPQSLTVSCRPGWALVYVAPGKRMCAWVLEEPQK